MKDEEWRMKKILTIVLWCLFLITAHAASFDCGKATIKAEKLICENCELSELDDELNHSYKAVLQREDVKQNAIISQRQWLKHERNICNTAKCIETAYKKRLKEIELMSSYGMVTLREPASKKKGVDHPPFKLFGHTPIVVGVGEFNYQTSINGADFSRCSNIKKNVESLICSNQLLLSLDNELSGIYSNANEQGRYERSQQLWLRKRDRCTTYLCLKKAYESRINEVKWMVHFDKNIPKDSLIRTLCEKLTVAASRRQILSITQGVEDINNDGQPETVQECDGGTTDIPCSEYYDLFGKKI
ncbi:MAG: lysozyme inhibitor LprI family protein, partial [Gallionella sp.]